MDRIRPTGRGGVPAELAASLRLADRCWHSNRGLQGEGLPWHLRPEGTQACGEGRPDSGAVGQVHLALDGKCLQDPGNRTANGTRVEIENCVSGSTERWTVASDDTVRVNGRCLNIAGSGSANGRQLQVWSCNGGTRQVWMRESAGQLVNPASGLCVTDPRSSRNNGVTPTMGACHARSSEQWTLPAQPILTPVGGACADDPLGVGTNGTVVDMFSCNGTPGQAWDFEPNGTIRISQYPNVCLTLHKSEPVLWVCGITSGQKWSVNRTGGLGSELAVGGACLATKSLTAFERHQVGHGQVRAGQPARPLAHRVAKAAGEQRVTRIAP